MKLTDSIKAVKPPTLKKGDTIGITAPSSQVVTKGVSAFIRFIEERGYKVKLGDLITHIKDTDYNAGSIKDRADDLNKMIRDPEVKAIFAGAGGFGAQMTSHFVDYKALMKNPKIIVGFSDTTYLLNSIYEKTGIISFLGPTAEHYNTDNDKICAEYTFDIIEGKAKNPYEVKNFDGSIIRRIGEADSNAIGRICGGNLTMMQMTIGTEFAVNTNGKIILIEEVGESSYAIERILDHLFTAGYFENPAAVVIGEFSNIKREPIESAEEGNPSVNEILVKKFGKTEFPVLIGYNFSHDTYNLTLPIGGLGKVDGRKRTFSIIDNSLV